MYGKIFAAAPFCIFGSVLFLFFIRYFCFVKISPVIVELSEEQKEKILSSPEFQHFLDRTSRIIERAICEKDVTFDYGKTEDVEG